MLYLAPSLKKDLFKRASVESLLYWQTERYCRTPHFRFGATNRHKAYKSVLDIHAGVELLFIIWMMINDYLKSSSRNVEGEERKHVKAIIPGEGSHGSTVTNGDRPCGCVRQMKYQAVRINRKALLQMTVFSDEMETNVWTISMQIDEPKIRYIWTHTNLKCGYKQSCQCRIIYSQNLTFWLMSHYKNWQTKMMISKTTAVCSCSLIRLPTAGNNNLKPVVGFMTLPPNKII